MARESDRTANWGDEQDFFRAALFEADKAAQVDREIDREVLENYMMLPYNRGAVEGQMPFSRMHGNRRAGLMDNETHLMIESLVAIQMLSIMSEDGYIAAGTKPVGREDAYSSLLVQSLLERSNRVRGNYRANYVSMKDCFLFGGSVVAPHWDYMEGSKTQRFVDVDPFTGEEFTETLQVPSILRNDVKLDVIDRDDFLPDPSADTIEEMLYAIRRFVIPEFRALEHAETERWRKDKVNEALSSSVSPDEQTKDDWRRNIDRQRMAGMPLDYRPQIGYEMFCFTPYKARDGVRHRRMVMLNDVLVESRPNPSGISRTIPWYEMIVNPIRGRFWGVSPGHVARYTQDFLNGALMCLASATVKKSSVPIAYDKNRRPDLRRLKEFDGPIPVDGDPNSLRELQFNPQLGELFGLIAGLKEGQKNTSGAQGGVQGAGFGTKRLSATESNILFDQQLSRPQMMSQLFENEYLPARSQGTLELYQLFLESSEELAQRVGQSKMFPDRRPFLGDIMSEFDIKYVGSSKLKSKEAKLQFIERAFQVFGSIPGAAPLFPWGEAMVKWLENADMSELEYMVANPNGVEDFIQRTVATGPGAGTGNGNGTTPQLGASGLAPAQATGTALVGA